MGQERQAQLDFGAGMVRDVPPHLIDESGFYDGLNVLLDEDGSPFMRGGTANKSGAAFGAAGIRWLWDGYLAPGLRTVFANPSDFGVLDTNDSSVLNLGSDGMTYPKSAWELEGILFIGGGYLYGGSRKTTNYTTGTITTTNGSKVITGAGTLWSANVDAGMLIQVGDERVYVVESVDSNTQITLRDTYAGTTAGGKSYTATSLYKITSADPYESSDFYAVCGNRLCWLSGKKVRFSAVADPHTAWDADNEHELPEGSQGVGLDSIGGVLLVFTTGGIWALQGLAFDIVGADATPQHRLEILGREQVLWGPQGIASFGQTLIVPCTDGIYRIDGVSTPVKISKPIDKLYRNYTHGPYRPGKAVIFRGAYMLPILDVGSQTVDLLVGKVDRPKRVRSQPSIPWTRLDGQGGNVAAFAIRSGADVRQPVLLGADNNATSRILDCSGFFDPAAAIKRDADGTDFILKLITRDYATGRLALNVVRKARARYEMTDAASDNPTIQLDYGLGIRQPNVPEWGSVLWGAFVWANAEDAEFQHVEGDAPEDNGLNPYSWRINERTRYIRYRLRCEDPVAYLALRSLETFSRASPAVRR